MEAITPTTPGQAVVVTQPPVNSNDSAPQSVTPEVATGQSSDNGFSEFLLKSLGRDETGIANEEELFAGSMGAMINEKDPEAAKFYVDKVKELSVTMARGDGYVPVEDVARAALRAAVDAGEITKEEAEVIHAKAFQAAQIDDVKDMLFDGRGETSAVAPMAEAMFNMKSVLEQIEAGTLKVDPRSLDTPSNRGFTPGTMIFAEMSNDPRVLGGTRVEGTQGESSVEEGEGSEKQVRFTWKHVASDGNLAILLPTRLNGQIAGVSLYDSEGNLVEEGDYSKRTGDNRAVFRFDSPGENYGEDIDAVVTLDSGETITYHVNNGGKRTYVPQDDGEKRSKTELEVEMKKRRDKTSGAGTSSPDSAVTSGSNPTPTPAVPAPTPSPSSTPRPAEVAPASGGSSPETESSGDGSAAPETSSTSGNEGGAI